MPLIDRIRTAYAEMRRAERQVRLRSDATASPLASLPEPTRPPCRTLRGLTLDDIEALMTEEVMLPWLSEHGEEAAERLADEAGEVAEHCAFADTCAALESDPGGWTTDRLVGEIDEASWGACAAIALYARRLLPEPDSRLLYAAIGDASRQPAHRAALLQVTSTLGLPPPPSFRGEMGSPGARRAPGAVIDGTEPRRLGHLADDLAAFALAHARLVGVLSDR